MKTKTLNKKLRLNKKTIANLGKNAMGNINGGDLTNPCTEPETCINPCLPHTTPPICPPTIRNCTMDDFDPICQPLPTGTPNTCEVHCE